MTRYDDPLWLRRVPRARRPPFPRHRGSLEVDVVVIGGGLTGVLATYGLTRAGARVALVDKDRVGQGATAAAPGVITPAPGASFAYVRQRYGLRSARAMWDASRRAALELMTAVRRAGIRCDLASGEMVRLALNPSEGATLEREYSALREGGFEVTWLKGPRARELTGVEAVCALKVPGAGALDPYRACLGFLKLAMRDKLVVFEQTEARRIRAARKSVEVITADGTLTCGTVVIATSSPTVGLTALRRHFRAEDRYFVALPPLPPSARRRMGGDLAVATDSADVSHVWRWTRDGVLVFGGGAQPAVPTRQREHAIVQRTGQLMYELSLLFPQVSGTIADAGWSEATTVSASDGMMVVGTHRAFPRHVFALGLGAAGANGAWLASRIVTRRCSDAATSGDELFDMLR